MAAVISFKVRSPKMLPEQDGFSKVSELSPCLVFATESVSELFKLGYLNPLTFFHFVIFSD